MTAVATAEKYQDVRSRLRALEPIGPIFRGLDVEREFNWKPEHARTYLARWKRQGLVHALGGRSDVYFNLVADPNWHSHLAMAVAIAMPFAMETGVALLSAAGVTTQLTDERHFIVPVRENLYKIDVAVVESRPLAWVKRLEEEKAIPYTGMLVQLPPGAVVADLLLHSPEHRLDPDDLDLGELAPLQRQLLLRLLDAPPEMTAEEAYGSRFDAERAKARRKPRP